MGSFIYFTPGRPAKMDAMAAQIYPTTIRRARARPA